MEISTTELDTYLISNNAAKNSISKILDLMMEEKFIEASVRLSYIRSFIESSNNIFSKKIGFKDRYGVTFSCFDYESMKKCDSMNEV